MKKYALIINIISLLLISNIIRAENDMQKFERNLNEREQLITAYDSIKNQFKDSSWFNIRDLALLQARLIQKDKYIINELLALNEDFKKLEITHDELSKKYDTAEASLKEKEQWIEWGMYGGSAIALLLIVFFILFIVKTISASKHKKKVKNLENLHEQYQEKLEKMDALAANASKIIEMEAAYNKIIEDNNNNFEHEKRGYNSKLLDTQNTLENLKQELQKMQMENNQLKVYKEQLEQKVTASENLQNNSNEEELNNRITELERELQEKENHITEKYWEEKTNLVDENSNLRKQLEEEKLYVQELKSNVEQLQNEISLLKSNSTTESPVPEHQTSHDTQLILEENNRMRTEIEEYKKIINEELEFRKDILKLIEDLKKK